MTIRDHLTPYEFLSQSYYAYLARPIRSTIYVITLIALVVSLCVDSFDTPVWAILLTIALSLMFVMAYTWTIFRMFKNKGGAVPVAFEITDKELVITYGNKESKVSSGTSFQKGSAIWTQGRRLFLVRKPIMAGMLLPKETVGKIIAALEKHGWVSRKPAPSVLSNVSLVVFVVIAWISIPILALV